MKVVVCTGDSHTWGQGATGYAEGFAVPLMGGDLRPASWDTDAYVNILRRRFGDEAEAWDMEKCAASFGVPLDTFGAVLKGTYTATSKMKLARLFFYENADAQVSLISGSNRKEVTLHDIGHPNAWREVSLFLDGEVLSVEVQGSALLHRIEWYGGDVAVVNSGVGSSTCGQYTDRFVGEKVNTFTPFAILAEAHTVNNWLTGQPPEAYCEELCAYLAALQKASPRVALMTVSPVLGGSVNSAGVDYSAYVSASCEAARKAGVPLIDANRTFVADWSQFDDIWHPNDVGHRLYAQAAAPMFESWLK